MASKKLMDKLPVVPSIAGIPNRAMGIILIPILIGITGVEAAWNAYILAEFSNDLTDFRKIIAGLEVAFLALLIIGFFFGWIFGLMMMKQKVIKLLAHIAFLKGLILFIIGIIHLISVVKDQDEFKANCNLTRSTSFCNNINTINVAFASGLFILQEILLFIIAIATNSLYLNSNNQNQFAQKNDSGMQFVYGNNRYEDENPYYQRQEV